MDVAGSDMNTNDEIVFVASRVRRRQSIFVFSIVEYTALRVSGRYRRYLFLRRLFSSSSEKGFFPCSSRSLFTSSSSSFAYRFAYLETVFFACFFRLALSLICVPSTEIASLSNYPSSVATFRTHWNTYSTVAWLNRCLKL